MIKLLTPSASEHESTWPISAMAVLNKNTLVAFLLPEQLSRTSSMSDLSNEVSQHMAHQVYAWSTPLKTRAIFNVCSVPSVLAFRFAVD